ncbi:hypothetical protein EVAR_57544_1 [Eumeta japonica]|uniref:Uncharacterized protein n=1 Tax=Eumeta variegata TaxID=151549 RepID=A0A4C1Y1A7_EUMVA|nr:hypothetical protein EVAR_57544_1 [Eumeta japonica]
MAESSFLERKIGESCPPARRPDWLFIFKGPIDSSLYITVQRFFGLTLESDLQSRREGGPYESRRVRRPLTCNLQQAGRDPRDARVKGPRLAKVLRGRQKGHGTFSVDEISWRRPTRLSVVSEIGEYTMGDVHHDGRL